MLTCPAVVARPQSCNANRIKAGRNGTPLAAIVLHVLRDIGTEAYESSMSTPLPNFSGGHLNPLSVHFLVTDLAAVQYAEIYNTTYGLDYFKNPTWPILPTLYPLDDVNAPFIHIAIKSDCQSIVGLVNLICCIMQECGISLPIIAASDLQADRPQYLISPTLQTQVADCVASGGNIEPPPNWMDLWKRIQELEVCCFSNSAQINLLKTRMSKAEVLIAAHELKIKQLQDAIAAINIQVGQIPAILAAIVLLQQMIQQIQETCCSEIPPENSCFNYQLLNGQEMVITPNQPVHLNLPTKVIDTEPPIVTTGPLWRADLSEDCIWSLDGIVRFKLNQWCAGTIINLVLVACGQRTIVSTSVVTSTSPQLIQMTFNGYLQSGGCNNVYLEVEMNDKTAQIVSFAEMKGCCT